MVDQIAKTYSFQDNAQMKLNNKIKSASDPKGIISMGKNGVGRGSTERRITRFL